MTQPSSSTPPLSSSAAPVAVSSGVGVVQASRSPLSTEANDENRVANHSIPFLERLPESPRDRPMATPSTKEVNHDLTAAVAWKATSDNLPVERRSSHPLPPLATTFKRPTTATTTSTTTPRHTVDVQQVVFETRSALTPRHNDANAPVSGDVEGHSEHLIFNDNPLQMKAMPAPTRSTGSAVDSTPPRPTAAMTRGTDSQGGGSSLSDPFQLTRSGRSVEQSRRPPTESTRSSSPSIIRDTPTRRPSGPTTHKDSSLHSQRSSIPDSPGTQVPPRSPLPNADWGRGDPETQEQALFEQRLCEDVFGVAVRKINQNGKSNLRYVKCILLDDHESLEPSGGGGASTRSIGSRRNASRRKLPRDRSLDPADGGSRNAEHSRRALTWGKKKDVVLPLDRFTCVRKGKTTERTRKNSSPATRLLSLISDDPEHGSLDIEAPTRLDRDKFARAFSRFLGVPLEGEDTLSAFTDYTPTGESKKTTGITKLFLTKERFSAAHSAPDLDAIAARNAAGKKDATRIMNAPLPVITAGASEGGQHLELQFDMVGKEPFETESSSQKFNSSSSFGDLAGRASVPLLGALDNEPKVLSMASSLNNLPSDKASTTQQAVASTDLKAVDAAHTHEGDDGTVLSSLTGAGFDHEIVEELHQALNDLRAELEESRAEAARAIKVAEQAIQSAENTNSKDWNSTVTHKAAAAAALAQKKSAEAMAKQRLAEERLAGERRTAAFWRRQAEAAEEEAGALQTRAAAAEVQRAAMEEELESERRTSKMLMESLKDRFSSSEVHQREALESSMERNRALELELETTRRELAFRNEEAKILQESLSEMIPATDNIRIGVRKKLARIGRPKKKGNDMQDSSASKMLLAINSVSSSSTAAHAEIRESASGGSETMPTESILKLHAETTLVRKQFELLRRATADELQTLPANAKLWAEQASRAIVSSQDEVVRLREKLALECATRRKLLHEVQDLRGIVRVYCRPRPTDVQSSPKSGASGLVSVPSHETLLLHRDKALAAQDGSSSRPMSFEFDRVFSADMNQRDVYNELEEVCLGVLDGYNICIMAYGQTGSGKTHTLLGDVRHSEIDDTFIIDNEGIQLQAARQLFYVAEQRSERYQDVFTFSIVEVYNERLCDLVAGTPFSEKSGKVVIEDAKLKRNMKKRVPESEGDGSSTQPPGSVSSKPAKLEIWTNQNGDTVVHGLTTVEVTSLDDIRTVWSECIAQRAARLSEQGIDVAEYESASHVIATLKVVSTNITTGLASVGKIQFVDLAGADLVKRKPSVGAKKTQNTAADGLLAGVGNNNDWKFANKSLATLSEVVSARCQFMRSVPYRNATLTHLLRDSLEADTKVIMVVCVSSNPKDMQETACSLRFGARMRRVTIGKATKHTQNNS